VESRDAETQTDPDITGVDADDFEEDDGSEEEDSETETSGEEEGAKQAIKIVKESKGTHARPVPRKKIELKYYFGEDMPDSELKKRK